MFVLFLLFGLSYQTDAANFPLFLDIFFLFPTHTVHSEHQGCAREGGPLLWPSWPVPPWHPKDHPSWPGGFQHGSAFSRTFSLCGLLTTGHPSLRGCPLPPFQQKQQEGFSALHQPSLPPGFTLPIAEPCHLDSGRCTWRWRYPAVLSVPSNYKRTEAVMVHLFLLQSTLLCVTGDVSGYKEYFSYWSVMLCLAIWYLKMSFWWVDQTWPEGFLCSVSLYLYAVCVLQEEGKS